MARQGKHVVMRDGTRILTIPRYNPTNAFTMGGIAMDPGLSPVEFRRLLQRAILREDRAGNTFENARLSQEVVTQHGLVLPSASRVAKAHHSRKPC